MARARILLLLASAAALATVAWPLRGGDALVVYCANNLPGGWLRLSVG
jgi:hypothetical protein